MTRFTQIVPKELWSKERTQKQIDIIHEEIAEFNRKLNELNSRIAELKEAKKIISFKIGNKHKYLNQLIEQQYSSKEQNK